MNFFSASFAAQRLEFVGRSAHVNAALDALAKRPVAGPTDMHFFWATKSPFSQWHPASFRVSAKTFTSAEQYMMYGKATLFGDAGAAEAILATDDPRKQKALGRGVTDYDDATWQHEARRIVYEGNCAKFVQNAPLREALLATADKLLVEAAPNDRRWGIGLAEDDERAHDKANWLGSNWLGYVLTLLRNDIRLTAREYPA